MGSACAPGMAELIYAHPPTEESSLLTEDYGGDVDVGTLSGSYGQALRRDADSLYGDDLIGVSMSRTQTQMRSPDTPASVKAKALNLPLDHFQKIVALGRDTDRESELERPDNTPPATPDSNSGKGLEWSASPDTIEARSSLRNSRSSSSQATGDGQCDDHSKEKKYSSKAQGLTDLGENDFPSLLTRQPLHPPEDVQIPQQFQKTEHNVANPGGTEEGAFTPQSPRASLTKSLLSGAESKRGRSLSSSGTNLFANLRKRLPDFQAPAHLNRSSTSSLPSSGNDSGQNTPTARTFRWSIREPLSRRGTGDSTRSMQPERSTVHHLATVSRNQLDGNVESLVLPTSPASTVSRARSNSEGSLYIGRRISGASAYDDISAFAHVTDMANSRFKAISDSFQNSTLKLPIAHVTDMANSRFKAITDSFQNSTLKLPKLPTIRTAATRRMAPEQVNGKGERGSDQIASSTDGKSHNHHYTSIKKIRDAAKGIDVETPQQRAHPVLSQALSRATGDMVILGGYRGSILRSAKPPQRQLWVPLKVGLNLRKVDLEVGLTRQDEEQMEQTIIPGGILSHIGPIDICRRLLRHMRKCPNAHDGSLRVHNWGYDWRLSPDLLSRRLIEFLESLESNQPGTPSGKRGAIVVAHSLGGLITRHAVNERPDLFAGVVYAGVPQHCVNILGPLRNGDDVLLSSRVLTAQVTFTIRTSFALLPEDGRCFIQKHTNKRYDVDFFDPSTWEEHHLSPCIKPPLHHNIREKEDHRKSLIGAFSDSLSGTSRRNSRVGLGHSAAQLSPTTEARYPLEEAAQKLTEKAQDARQDAEGNAEGIVGPSMTDSGHRPAVATAITIPGDLARKYLNRTLSEVAVFKSQLRFKSSHQESNLYPPHAFIFGKTVPTVYGARVASKEAIKYTDALDDLAFAAGDGVVLASAAQLPEGYRCVKGGRVESDRGHIGLMGDLEGMGRCIEAVIGGRNKGIGLGKQHIRHMRDPSDVTE